LEGGLGSADEAFLAEVLGIGGMQVTAITDAFDASGMPSASLLVAVLVAVLSLSARECVSRRFDSSFWGGLGWGELGRARRPGAGLGAAPLRRCST